MRPITIFTGQWADLTFDEICKIASGIGYEGVEIAAWGNHLNSRKAVEDKEYIKEI